MAEKEIEGSDFSAVIASELRLARNYDTEHLNSRRSLAIEYMRGEMNDTPPRPNGSSQTSRDFADTVQWMLPGIVRTYLASDQMVKYDKVREENDDWSRDASEYTNYSFLRENDGYKILYNATYDALQLGDGLACSYWEPEKATTKVFRNKTEMELAALMQEGWQPTGIAKPGKPAKDLVQDPMTGDWVEAEVPTLTVKLAKVEQPGRIKDYTCKPDNLFLNSSATEIENARFVAYRHDDKTRSDLMAMADEYGWDKKAIEDLPARSRGTKGEVDTARTGDRGITYDSPLRSGDEIDLFECYIRADKDGDGIAELIQAWWAGDEGSGTLLGDDEWEGDVPFTHIPCYPIPHQSDSQSVFDRTHDIARVKTVLLRGALDNLYATALPMLEVEENSVKNPDILVSKKFGGLIWKGKNTAPIVPHVTPFFADKAFAGLQYMDEMIAKRTGVSRTTMALDPEALQNQSATANQNNKDAAYSQIELVARNMAEYGGWQKFFAKRLRLAIQHEIVAQIPAPKEPNGFRTINAAQWDPNMAVTINVGLGTGSRDRDMQMLNLILNGQVGMADRLAAAGFKSKAIEFIPKIRNTAVKLAESSGIKNPEDFYPEITDEELAAMAEQANQPPPPDPKVQADIEKMQADVQMNAQKQQADQQMQAQQLQMDAAKAEQELTLKREQLAAEMQLKREQLAAELQLKREQLIAELQLKRELGMANAAAKVEASTSSVRPGGEPG
jgi:hypothetical protein